MRNSIQFSKFILMNGFDECNPVGLQVNALTQEDELKIVIHLASVEIAVMITLEWMVVVKPDDHDGNRRSQK